MRVSLRDVEVLRGEWTLSASGVFGEGRHLVTGPVGSGKSTLALLMAGISVPDAGTVVRDGPGPAFLSLPFPEHHSTGATVGEEITSWGVAEEPVLAAAELAGKSPEVLFRLSRGELKRLHLACVLSRRWDLLLLDEPYTALDCPGRDTLSVRLSAPPAATTVIFTHARESLPRVDRLWEIREGRLVDLGPVPEAIPRWSSPPSYMKTALEEGATPANISVEDVREALCRTDG
ncbi:MAG: energy-coupling factor ABC transporter ATP-binding protein [Methanomicrobiales archaeon]|nr:energy-coupling factor ABC transporter ATP-binding protein [Methanomicrobiales archaeon]